MISNAKLSDSGDLPPFPEIFMINTETFSVVLFYKKRTNDGTLGSEAKQYEPE